jgi:DNA invertase Pin-like site-specific DNA recombinase
MSNTKIAIYARASCKQDAYLLQLQVRRASLLAERAGLVQPRIFTDHSLGGTAEAAALYARGGLAQLRQACECGEINTIITGSPDRLSRNPGELAEIQDWALLWETRFIFVSEEPA